MDFAKAPQLSGHASGTSLTLALATPRAQRPPPTFLAEQQRTRQTVVMYSVRGSNANVFGLDCTTCAHLILSGILFLRLPCVAVDGHLFQCVITQHKRNKIDGAR